MAGKNTKVLTILLSSLVFFLCPNLATMPISIIPALLSQEDNFTQLCKSGSDIVTIEEDYQGNVSSKLQDCSIYESKNVKLSILFGIKGVIQIFVTPLFGFLIDKTVPLSAIMFSICTDGIAYLLYAFGNSYWYYLLGRGFNAIAFAAAGCGIYSAIFDVFTEDASRRKVVGVVHIFFFTGMSVGPAFGGVVHQFAGKMVAFLTPLPLLAVCFILTIPLWQLVIQRKKRKKQKKKEREAIPLNESGAPRRRIMSMNPLKPTSVFRLAIDPYILISVVALSLSNLGIICMAPTLSMWMRIQFEAEEYQQGIIWLPSIIFHLLGNFVGTILGQYYSRKMYIFIVLALILEGAACLSIPFISLWYVILVPIGVNNFCIALIEMELVPFISSLVDTRHTSVYGSISGIIMVGFSVVASLGSFVSGPIVNRFGFTYLQIAICCVYVVFSPFVLFTRRYWK